VVLNGEYSIISSKTIRAAVKEMPLPNLIIQAIDAIMA
jgi:hypothetical protein